MSDSDYNIVKSQMDKEPNLEMLERGIQYNQVFDKIRNENVKETFKELFDALANDKN